MNTKETMLRLTVIAALGTLSCSGGLRHSHENQCKQKDEGSNNVTQQRETAGRPSSQDGRTRPEVIILGGLHENHVNHPYYATSMMERIFETLKPDLVLIEIPVDRFVDGRYLKKDLEYLEKSDGGSEGHVAWRYCQNNNVECLPHDIAGRNEVQGSPQYSECEKRLSEVFGRIAEVHPDAAEGAGRIYDAMGQCDRTTARVANSSVCDRLTQHWHEIMFSVSGRYMGEVFPDNAECSQVVSAFWERRNRAMADNICQTAKAHPTARILVTVGRAHRPLVRQYLTELCPDIHLREYYELIDLDEE